MQNDRPLGEMSEDELNGYISRLGKMRLGEMSEDDLSRYMKAVDESFTRMRAELSRRERRSATRETGAQDD